MVTPDEQRAVQVENAGDDERFWGGIRDMNVANVEGHKGLVALAETKIAEQTAQAAEAAERAAAAKERLERLERGESVSGGLGKKFDRDMAIKAMGMTPRHARYLISIASLTEDELKMLPGHEVIDKAKRRAVRQILRARK
jgi:hypothetical protein